MTSPNQNYPRVCVEAGLTCEVCTAGTARELARACPDLSRSAASQLFVQIHTEAACAPMHRHFVNVYMDASVSAAPARKPATVMRPMAAVA